MYVHVDSGCHCTKPTNHIKCRFHDKDQGYKISRPAETLLPPVDLYTESNEKLFWILIPAPQPVCSHNLFNREMLSQHSKFLKFLI